MKDRVPKYPGRVKITHADGTSEYVTLERADEPVSGNEGTPLNKATLLSDDTAAMLGFSTDDDPTVNEALATIHKMFYPSYMAFCTNANSDSLDAAFGKNNEDLILNIGKQLYMYSAFKGVNLSDGNKKLLLPADKFEDICKNKALSDIVCDTDNIFKLVNASPFAIGKFEGINRGIADCVLYDGPNGINKLNFTNISYSENTGSFSNEGTYIKASYEARSTSLGIAKATIPLTTPISEHRYYKYLKIKFASSPASTLQKGYEGSLVFISLPEMNIDVKKESRVETISLTNTTISSSDSFNALIGKTPINSLSITIGGSKYSYESSKINVVCIEKIWLSEG